jgi:alkylmercury lyase
VIGFSGLTLRETPHELEVDGRQLHAWCAWDTLFLPALLGRTARVRSPVADTSAVVELVVSPRGIEATNLRGLHVSFPSIPATDPDDITGSFCCHVFFLRGADAARAWSKSHPGGHAVDIQTAFDLGRRAIESLLAADLLQPADEVVT